MNNVLIAIVISGFLAALAAPALYHFAPKWAGRLCALLPLTLFVCLLTAIGPVAAGTPIIASFPWIPSLGVSFSLYLDGLGMLFALLVTGAGGLALLAGLILLGRAAGTMDIPAILADGDLVRGHTLYVPILLLILAGAFTKSAQFPFHFWLPNAMAAPTPVSAYLHSATMIKLGVFLLARFSPVVGGTEVWLYTVSIVGALTMMIGAAYSILEHDLKRILILSKGQTVYVPVY